MRLIDANELTDRLNHTTMVAYPNLFPGLLAAVEVVDDSPTVDAVEVVHGRWEDMFGSKYANPRYRCSACKEKALYRLKKNGLDQWKEVQALTDYCPNCGAKMDLKGDNYEG